MPFFSSLSRNIIMNLQNMVLGVEDYTQQHLTRYIDELRELCAIDTYTYHKAGLDEMARILAARMRGLGMDTTIIENKAWGNDLLGVMRGEGHGNVVLL